MTTAALFTDDTHERLVVVPLVNFQTSVHVTKIGEHIELTPFSSEDKNHFTQIYPYLTDALSPLTASLIQSKLSCSYISEPGLKRNEMIYTEVRCALTAFRLTKPGLVGSPVMYDFGAVPSQGGAVSTIGTPLFDFMVRRNIAYDLDDLEVGSVKSYYKQLIELENDPKLKGLIVAIRRFNQSYSR